MTSEFDLISRYFNRPGLTAQGGSSDILLGIGDDCALLGLPAGQELAISMDVLVENVHFPAGADPGLVAQRALRINLSDLAAMGASPLGFTLGLTLPEYDEKWLQGFSDGLLACSREFSCPLLGGNTTRGPLNIAVQVHGTVQAGSALKRSGARPGELVCVSGPLGTAATVSVVTGKKYVSKANRSLSEKLYFEPLPLLDLGKRLRGLASSCVDVSDGLLADLGHIARASTVALTVEAEKLPVHSWVSEQFGKEESLEFALSGGDDYVLAFTVPEEKRAELHALAAELALPVAVIGRVTEPVPEGVYCVDSRGRVIETDSPGYRHF